METNINQITPQQKRQALQLYSQYLDSLNKPNTNPVLLVNQRPDVILPIGISGSGKSTFIKSLPQKNLVVIEPDAMRVEFTGDMNDKSKDKEIYIEAANRAIQAIKQGKQVAFDTTNLTKDKRLPFIEAIKKALPNANIQYKLMELNPELAKQRIKEKIDEYDKAKKEANARPYATNIPQNLQSGVKQYGTLQYANKEARKLLGKNVTSIELIENEFRTRTTRTDYELLKYDIKVGSYIKMFGKDQFGNTKNIIVKITKITKGYNDATWYKEGWTEKGLEKLKKHTNSANSVEFKVVTKRANVSDATIDRHAESYKQMLEDIKSEDISNYDNQLEQVKKFDELQERLRNKEFIEGAKFAYESSEGLQSNGTQEQYNDYTSRVSLGILKNPSSGGYNYTSQVKDIVYHGTNRKFDKFDLSFNSAWEYNEVAAIFFSNKREVANNYIIQNSKLLKDKIIVSSIINVKDSIEDNHENLEHKGNTKFKSNLEKAKKEGKDSYIARNINDGGEGDVFVVFEPEQIHILGGKQDIEGFKEFVGNPVLQKKRFAEVSAAKKRIKNRYWIRVSQYIALKALNKIR